MNNISENSGVETSALRVLLAEHCPVVRKELREQLGRLPLVEVVGEASRSNEALDLFLRTRPDAVIAAICLPEQGGFHILRSVKSASAKCAVILTSRSPDPFVDKAARMLGAAGVCPAGDGFAQLPGVIQRLQQS